MVALSQSSRRQRLALSWLSLLAGLSLVSALAVVQTSHACRELHTELQRLEVEQWALQEDYGRLLLEQSTWASHYRVQRMASSELGMQAPEPSHIRVVQP